MKSWKKKTHSGMRSLRNVYISRNLSEREIQADIQDLQRAVSRLKEDYEVLDRLGTGI